MSTVMNCKRCDYIQVPLLYYIRYRDAADREIPWDGSKLKSLLGAFCTQCGEFIRWVTPTDRYQQVYALQRGQQNWCFPIPAPWDIVKARKEQEVAS